MGKTTLAKLVYDDAAEPIANHFALKAWVCVSNEFDKVKVRKTLLNSLSSQSSSSEDFHEIQSQLKKALTGKRVLIVLDDLWSDMCSKWDDLRSPYLEGAPGSKILVTTRDQGIATWMGGHKKLDELKKLSDVDCWSLFETHAFQHMNLDEHPNLGSIGRRIVEKCGGLPLAAKELGGLVRSEPREREWERVLHSKIWDLPPEKCDIIPALRLSYIHLPSHLKRCYAYCAMFSQDYEFRKEELILLRVLSLSNYTISEVPDSIGKLIHLRYLNLSHTQIEWLPDSIGNLFFLQTLKLSCCVKLIRLPITIGNLINLRHVDVTGAVQSVGWFSGRKESNGCSRLSTTLLDSYGGPEFSHWIGDALFSKMVDLRLINCKKCTSLPCLRQLPSLKQLRME